MLFEWSNIGNSNFEGYLVLIVIYLDFWFDEAQSHLN